MASLVLLLVSVLGGILLGFLRRPPLILILILNLVPVAGVLWAGWSPLQLLLLYWIENVAVGVFNYLKLRAYEAHRPEPGPQPFKVSSFFLMHYGMFTLVHGIFAVAVGAFYGGQQVGATAWTGDWLSFAAAAVSLAAIHGMAWMRWEAEKGWNEGSVDAQMFAPYGRIIVLHLTVLGGAFILAATHAPIVYVALLAVLKTFIETGWAMMGDKGGQPDLSKAGPMTMESGGKRWVVGGGKPPRIEKIKD